MASIFCLIAVMIVLPMHGSAFFTLCYTIVTRCSCTNCTEYKYKVFARVISPCNSSSIFTFLTFPANTYALHIFVTFATCKSLHWYMNVFDSRLLALLMFSALRI